MRKRSLALSVLLGFAMVTGLIGCTDDDIPELEDNTYPAVEPMPTNDLMTQTTNCSVTILGSGFSQVGEAFIKRVKNQQTEITDETDAILLKGSDIDVWANDDNVATDLMEALRQGKILIIDQPTVRQMREAAWLVYLKTYPDDSLPEESERYGHIDTAGEEHDDHVCYDMLALDAYDNIFALNDIFNEDDEEEEQELTPYMSGLHADPLAVWLEEQINNRRALQIGAATRGATGDLSSKMSAQNITHSYTLNPSGSHTSKLEGRSCVFTISTNIWAAYKYDEDADYYLVEQVVLGNSNNFWVGSWTEGKWNYQGFFLSKMTVSNGLRKNDSDTYLKNSDDAVLIDFSPTSTSGQHTTTVEESWNLSGSIGFSGLSGQGAVGGGVGGSVSNSYSTEDMTITALCMNDDNCQNNAAWQYDIYKQNYDHSGWSGYSFQTPPTLGTNAYKSAQCWQWRVKHPKNYSKIFMKVMLGFDHSYNSYRNYTFSCESENNNFFNGWYYHDIEIRLPYRGAINQ